MSARESSVASSVDFYDSDARLHAPTAHTPLEAAPAKRKAEDASSWSDKKRRLHPNGRSSSVSSRSRLCTRLPPAVWQHIFSFCSLADLGRLIQVNRLFHSTLTDVSNVSLSEPAHGCLPLLTSEALWASARNAYNPNAPRPLPGRSELQMWQLVWSKTCQFCTKRDPCTSSPQTSNIWHQGPGESRVRTIWPFAIRACGPCLMQRCQTVSGRYFL